MKARPGHGKYLLRRVLDRYVPRALIERPKMGFAVPINAWLRGPLKRLGREAARRSAAQTRRHLRRRRRSAQKWQEHLSGKRNWQYLLWDVLMFQAWKERWLPNG